MPNRISPNGRAALLAGLIRAVLCLGVVCLAPACAPPLGVKNEALDSPRYIRYTLRSQAGFPQTAFRSNYLSFPAGFKAGSKVTFPFYSSQYLDLDFNGVTCRMYFRDLPYPTEPEGLKRTLEKYFASTEEELNLAGLDKSTRDQVERGTASMGMTKEHVFMALGYPSHVGANTAAADELSKTQIFEQNLWHYRYNEIMWIPSWHTYQFNNDGILVARNPP